MRFCWELCLFAKFYSLNTWAFFSFLSNIHKSNRTGRKSVLSILILCYYFAVHLLYCITDYKQSLFFCFPLETVSKCEYEEISSYTPVSTPATLATLDFKTLLIARVYFRDTASRLAHALHCTQGNMTVLPSSSNLFTQKWDYCRGVSKDRRYFNIA